MISFIRGLFLNNVGTKIMALILAVITWIYIYQAHIEKAPTPIKVPVIIETPPQVISRIENMDSETIKEIEVEIEYSRRASPDIANLICKRQVKPASEQLQPIIVELTPSDFNLKPGVTIKKIIPDKIRVILMAEASKFMRIKTENVIQGAPLKGYRITSVKAIPSEILVRGPKNILDKYSEIPIVKIDVGNRNSFFSQVGRVEPMENAKITTEDAFIVEVRIDEETTEVVYSVKINLLIPPDFPRYPIQIKPQEKALKFKGPASSIKELKPRHINLFVNLGSLYTNPSDLKPPQSFAPQLELRFTSDAPREIELTEQLDQIKLEILPESQPPPPEIVPVQPPEQPKPQ